MGCKTHHGILTPLFCPDKGKQWDFQPFNYNQNRNRDTFQKHFLFEVCISTRFCRVQNVSFSMRDDVSETSPTAHHVCSPLIREVLIDDALVSRQHPIKHLRRAPAVRVIFDLWTVVWCSELRRFINVDESVFFIKHSVMRSSPPFPKRRHQPGRVLGGDQFLHVSCLRVDIQVEEDPSDQIKINDHLFRTFLCLIVRHLSQPQFIFITNLVV